MPRFRAARRAVITPFAGFTRRPPSRKHAFHIGVGDPAEVIVQYAEDKRCEQIVMGPRGMGTMSNLVLGSVASKVIPLAKAPVLVK